MSLYDTLKKKLPAELMTQVEEALGDDFDFDVVPRSRLNKVIKQRNELKEQLANQDPGTGAGDDGDEGKGTPGATKGLSPEAHKKALEEALAAAKAESDKAVADLKLQYAVMDKLRGANAQDPELIWNGGLLDRTKLSFNEKGELQGMDEQIKSLSAAKAYLFGAGGAPGGTGREGGAGDHQESALDKQLGSIFQSFGVVTDVDHSK